MRKSDSTAIFVEVCLRLVVGVTLGMIFVGATIPTHAAELARAQAPAATPTAAPTAAAAPAALQVPVTTTATTTATTAAATPAAVWQAINEPVMDPAKSTVIENLVLVRDRIRITLIEGTIEFTAPVNGKPFGAIFRGKGLVEIAPPNFMEHQQLHEFTGQDTLSMPFTEGVLWFTDKTYDEIAGQVRWKTSDAAGDNLFAERSKRDGSPRARLFKGILSLDHERTALFEADLHTEAKGWIQVADDALEPEEISAGRWVNPYGYWQFETWLSFPAGNRTAEAAFRFPLAKADFHVASYEIDATVTDRAELEATTRIHLEMLAAGEQVLSFTLNPHLRVDRVTDGAGRSLAFFQPRDPGINGKIFDEFLEVALPAATSFDPVTLEFHYAGKRVVHDMGGGNFFCESFGWYPAVENEFALRSDFDMTFHSPKDDEFVATGDKVSERVDGKWRLTKWKSNPSVSVAGFAFGDYKVVEQKVGDAANTMIEVYANKNPSGDIEQIKIEHPDAPLGQLDPAELSKEMGIELGNMVRLFENYYGPYPYHTLAITNIPGDYGQGWPGLIYLSAISFMDQTQQVELGIPMKDLIWVSDYWRGHETSHQWWGHKVGWKSYHDQWLSEGFAQFSGDLYVEFRENQKQYLLRLQQDREELLTKDLRNHTYESLGPIWMGQRMAPSDEPQAYQTVIYDKGGLVLHMLRMMLYDPRIPDPDAHFKAMMQDFTATYNNKAASTEDFKAIVEKHMVAHMDLDGNHMMDWFFNQYVYGTGVPEYHFMYSSSTASDGKVKVTLIFDRTGVPEGWKDTLPIYMYHSGKPALAAWVSIRSNHQTMDFELPAAPEKLAIDSNEDTLAIVKQ
ncbi:MAG: M1 family aminopeptidase [Candidatus Acidiferrales bacterium]